MTRQVLLVHIVFPLVLFVLAADIHGKVRTDLGVVPKPRVVESFGFSPYVPLQTVFRFAVRDTAEIQPAFAEICSTSVALFGHAPGVGRKGRFVVWGGVPGVDAAFDRLCRGKKLSLANLGTEGYALLIERKEAVIVAPTATGVFYGLMTLNQLLRGSGGNKGLPLVKIVDWPDLRVRGVMDDISRGPVPTAAYFREQIRRCAEMKVNTLTYYTEHVVATRSHPDFAPPGGAIGIDEWKDIASYARAYHIDLIGNFQSFGHFDKILANPRYARLADGKSLLSPAYPESYRLLEDIYREMVPAFSSRFFEVNCDETFDLGRGASKAMVDSLGKGRVYLGHILKLREILRQLGVRMMMWGDVLLENPDVIDLVPRDVVIGTWTYDSLASFVRYITPFRSRGFDVLVVPGVLNSGSVMPNFRQSFANIGSFVRDGVRERVMGALTTVWDDGGTAQFKRDWYGVAFAADRMWNCDTLDRSFDRRFDVALYGDRERTLSRGIESLLRLADLSPTDGMSEQNLWLPVIPQAGRSLPVDMTEWDQVLKISRSADAILGERTLRFSGSDLEAMRYVAELYAASARLRLGIRDAANEYARAVRYQGRDRMKARECLTWALDTVASLETEYSRLKARNAAVWLMESRLYWLDSVERHYDERIQDLRDVSQRIRAALGSFEKGLPLPARPEVRLEISELNGWYFRDWLVTGPIDGSDQDTDYIAAMGGERSKTPPAVTQEFLSGGKTYRWSRLSSRSVEVDFQSVYPSAGRATVYASAFLDSPKPDTMRAMLGIGGRVKVFVNGSPVFEAKQEKKFDIDSETFLLPLAQGRNHILLKISRGGEWGFSLRLPDVTVRNRKNRYHILERP